MIRLLPGGMRARLLLMILGALLLAQLLTLAIVVDERRIMLAAIRREQVVDQMAPVLALVRAFGPEARDTIIESVSTRRRQFSISPVPPNRGGERTGDDRLLARASAFLARRLDVADGGALITVEEVERRGRWRRHHLPYQLRAAVRLEDGQWLTLRTDLRGPQRGFALPYMLMLGITALGLVLAVVLSVRWVTAPLQALAGAADRFGRGQPADELRETGPREIRYATRAFNLMQARISRFVADRTRLLASLGHDLRTPITALRLRAEFVEDEGERDRMLATLAEMQRMVEATLAFARDEAASEPLRTVDLSALIESIAEDQRALGRDVAFDAPDGPALSCRPLALTRALRNLIENAVRYGERASVHLVERAQEVMIEVLDDGPGIPSAMREQVFEPFVRLESSRSSDAGGVGLGLAIARSIVRGHGGDVTLHDRPPEADRPAGGGLRVVVTLPRT